MKEKLIDVKGEMVKSFYCHSQQKLEQIPFHLFLEGQKL
jgi:hypothetical protein